MGRFFYSIYAMVVIAIMGNASFSSPQTGSSNANSYYHGGSSGSSWSSSSGGGGHK